MNDPRPPAKVDNWTRVSAAAGIVSTVLAVFSFFDQRRTWILPVALLGLAAAALVLVRRTPLNGQRVIGLVIGVPLALAGIALFFPQAREKVTPTSPVEIGQVALEAPQDDTKTPINGCFLVKFKGRLPAGHQYVIAHNTAADPRLYFGDKASNLGGDSWSMPKAVGTDDAGRGEVFHLWIVAMESQWVEYNVRANPVREPGDDRWWSSDLMPPGAVVVGEFSVLRDDQPLRCP